MVFGYFRLPFFVWIAIKLRNEFGAFKRRRKVRAVIFDQHRIVWTVNVEPEVLGDTTAILQAIVYAHWPKMMLRHDIGADGARLVAAWEFDPVIKK